jgi:hypothetical protein
VIPAHSLPAFLLSASDISSSHARSALVRFCTGAPTSFLSAPPLDHLYHIFASHFLLFWFFLLLVVIVCAWRLRSYYTPDAAAGAAVHGDARSSPRFSPTDGLCLALMLIFLAGYIFLIFYKENFAYYDDDMLTEFTLQGKTFPTPIWPDTGRFYPLADQEFNLLKSITHSPIGYHGLIAAELVVFVFILFSVLGEYRVRYRALMVIFALATPAVLIPFTGFVYPERNVIFWFAVLVLCLLGYDRTQSPVYFAGCLAATHVALYYKEIVVLFVVTFALARVALDLHRNGISGRSRQTMIRKNLLSLGMLAVSTIYVMLFLVAMIPHHKFSYIAEHREGIGSVLGTALQLEWLPLLLFVVLAARVWRFLFASGQLDPLWDPLALGALAYCFGVLALKLSSGYYMAPGDFIAILYLAKMSSAWLAKPTVMRTALVTVLFLLVLVHGAAYSAFRIVERKQVIALKTQVAEFLLGYESGKSGHVTVFFPFTGGYNLMGFSSFLKYEGLPLAGQNNDATAEGLFVIEGREDFADDRCVNYRDYVCIHADNPPPNALIVVLPDDDASSDQVAEISRDATLLFSRQAPAILARTDSWFRLLHAVSPEFSDRELPQHWLQIQVFKSGT